MSSNVIKRIKEANIQGDILIDSTKRAKRIDVRTLKIVDDYSKQAHKKKDMDYYSKYIKDYAIYKNTMSNDIVGMINRYAHLTPALQKQVGENVKRRQINDKWGRGDFSLKDVYEFDVGETNKRTTNLNKGGNKNG